MRCRLRCLWYVPLTLLAVVLVGELALQLGALWVHGQSRLVPEQWRQMNRTRVLALGDSNTYGLYLKAEEAWPAQLEQSWNSAYPQSPIEVLNLGFPATNSFRVLDNLPALLDKLSPDIVLIMVGFNDFWTPVETLSSAAQPSETAVAWRWLKNHSRLYRLYLIWSRSSITQQNMTVGSPRDIAQLDLSKRDTHLVKTKDGTEFFLGVLSGDPSRHRDELAKNLQSMVEMIKNRGKTVYLMTYPSNWGFYPGANKRIREVALQQNYSFIDITPLFVARCASGPVSCEDLLFHDGHAKVQGNALVAEAVRSALLAELTNPKN